jgi:prophage regulatory protein
MEKAISPSILRNKQVRQRTGLSRSTLYLAIKNGTFPAPITFSVGWLSGEIDEWINRRIAASRTPSRIGACKPADTHKCPQQVEQTL